MTKEDVQILSKYYDKMFQIATNKSFSILSAEMKMTVIHLLEKYDRMVGCSKCNSNIPRIMLEGCRLYKQNEHLLNEDKIIENSVKDEDVKTEKVKTEKKVVKKTEVKKAVTKTKRVSNAKK